MLRNYLLIAFRNLRVNKSYALINILGLTVGIVCCLLLFFVIQFETSFDNFHTKKDRIYRVVTKGKNAEGGEINVAGVPFPTATALRVDHPELEKVAAIYGSTNDQISVLGGSAKVLRKFKEEKGLYYTESEFFQMFDYKWLAGDAKTALSDPNSVVLSREIAEKYFGSWQSAIGQSIKHENKNVLKVTGILDKAPANTDFPLKIVVSYATLRNTGIKSNLNDWVSIYGSAYCFVLLPPRVSPVDFDKSLTAFVKKYKPAEYASEGLALQPLSDIHSSDKYRNFTGRTFSRDLILSLALIGIFLLLIACVNFINLATAQAVNRSREVGVRKVLGSNRRQLVLQFLGETGLITCFSIMLACALAFLLMPALRQLLQTEVAFTLSSTVLLFLVVLFVVVTLLSGFYPAVILSGFNPATALKSKITASMVGGISLRRALVILQFVVAQVLIVGTIVVVRQMNYFRNASLGFTKDAVVTVPIPTDSISETKIDYLRDQLSRYPGVDKLTFSFASPADNGNWQSDFKYDHAAKNSDFEANLKWADANYFNTYDLKFVAGEPYGASDTVRGFVVNETLVRKLGISDPRQIIGKQLNFWEGSCSASSGGYQRFSCLFTERSYNSCRPCKS